MTTSLDPAQDRYFDPAAPDPVSAGKHHGSMNHSVPAMPTQPWLPEDRAAVSANVKQSRDRAQYTRQQKGHSLILHLLFGMVVLWIPAIYISCSPNHYWHA